MIVTLVSRDWLEALLRINPDAGSGAVEWVIVLSLAVSAGLLAWAARREWRSAASI
ncbi:hypothetical protein [Microlunatus ginsengisoli]